ncbi:hypothetical protein PVL29_001498 [Vitis rotundifolia]|uniref:DUF4283 domain-containing protein n=1 Tax=Vitis rotundifolia TaxID=103349 RepID=A0AA39AM21_VITRO|nr:hypothetical protein PVL29_001498 [Vitis rotundifolia]
MGPESLGFLREGLTHCIKDGGDCKWGREWKEKGRTYSLTCGANKAGWYLRLGVADSERKRFSIFIPKGKGDKGGWVTMEKELQKLEGAFGKKADNRETREVRKAVVERSYVEAAKGTSWRNTNSVRVKIKREEMKGNLQKLENCVVVSWNSRSEGEEDLEKLGRLWANSWGLKGSLGLARMERNRALLEFEILEEARRVLGLEHWSPRSGCRTEEEVSSEIWVRIVGLPISLWTPMILKRVREECGGLVGVDPLTECLGELQWARILVKAREDVLPSVLEAEIEEETYILSLWWESSPVLRKNSMGCSPENGRKSGEVRDDISSRAGMHVEEGLVGRIETLQMAADLMEESEHGPGWQKAKWVQVRERAPIDEVESGLAKSGPSLGLKVVARLDGPALTNRLMGSHLIKRRTEGDEADEGPSARSCWAEVLEGPKLKAGLVGGGPVLIHSQTSNKGLQKKNLALDSPGSKRGKSSKMEPYITWDTEEVRKVRIHFCNSAVDSALEEEATRYDSKLISWDNRDMGNSHPSSSYFDRTPEGEFYDRSGSKGEEVQNGNMLWLTVFEGSNENGNGCWDRGEINGISEMAKDMEGDSGMEETEMVRNEEEEKWEESSLAKFSQFLGFPTKGLEKEILSFLTKIRKRWERIHSRELLEKSKFDRELKRLECSVNYEGGNKHKGLSKGKGNQLLVIQ